MMSLLSLPNELLLQIGGYLPLKNLSRLLLTSRFLNILLTPLFCNLVASPFLTLPNALILQIAQNLVPQGHSCRNLSRLLRASPFLKRLLTPLLHELAPSTVAGRSALLWATSKGHEALVKILLERGTCVNDVDFNGDTPLHRAVERGFKGIVRLLLGAKELNINSANFRLETSLHYVSLKFGYSALLGLLLEAGADVNAKNGQGGTALHVAAEARNLDACKILLEWGVDMNVRNEKGETAMILASDLRIVRILCEKGADMNLQGLNGMTALHYEAYPSGYGPAKMKILLDYGANTEVGEKRYEKKPLHTAALSGYEKGVEMLLESGAIVDVKDANGVTPLSKAAMARSAGVVKLLLKEGAMPYVKDRSGVSPLARARGLSYNTEVVRLMEDRLLELDLELGTADRRDLKKERKSRLKDKRNVKKNEDQNVAWMLARWFLE